jgi:hypothetical protein
VDLMTIVIIGPQAAESRESKEQILRFAQDDK